MAPNYWLKKERILAGRIGLCGASKNNPITALTALVLKVNVKDKLCMCVSVPFVWHFVFATS